MGTRVPGNRQSKVAVRLREIRNARHLSQRQLAARLEVPRTYISKIENGRAMPTLSSLQRLANALSVPMWEMVHDARYEREREIATMMEDPFLSEIAQWAAGLDNLHRAMVLGQFGKWQAAAAERPRACSPAGLRTTPPTQYSHDNFYRHRG